MLLRLLEVLAIKFQRNVSLQRGNGLLFWRGKQHNARLARTHAGGPAFACCVSIMKTLLHAENGLVPGDGSFKVLYRYRDMVESFSLKHTCFLSRHVFLCWLASVGEYRPCKKKDNSLKGEIRCTYEQKLAALMFS